MKSEKTKRQEQAEQTKQNIFSTAVEEFAKKGYNHVAVEDICKKCGVSKGTFYVHFKAKEDIVKINLLQKIKGFGVLLSDYLVSHSSTSASERLSYYLNLFFQLISEIGVDSAKSFLAVETALSISNTDISYKELLFLPELKNIINDGLISKEFDNRLGIDILLKYLVSFIIGVLYMWVNGEAPPPLNEISKELIPRFIKGIS